MLECVQHDHMKHRKTGSDYIISGRGRHIPYNYTAIDLKYLCISIEFLDSCLNHYRITLFGVVKTVQKVWVNSSRTYLQLCLLIIFNISNKRGNYF